MTRHSGHPDRKRAVGVCGFPVIFGPVSCVKFAAIGAASVSTPHPSRSLEAFRTKRARIAVGLGMASFPGLLRLESSVCKDRYASPRVLRFYLFHVPSRKELLILASLLYVLLCART